jgi:hypothetical protein
MIREGKTGKDYYESDRQDEKAWRELIRRHLEETGINRDRRKGCEKERQGKTETETAWQTEEECYYFRRDKKKKNRRDTGSRKREIISGGKKTPWRKDKKKKNHSEKRRGIKK